MRQIALLLFMSIRALALACPWAGGYITQVNGVEITLYLACDTNVTGSILADGYAYTLQFTGSDVHISGIFKDPAEGGEFSCSAELSGDTVRIHIGVEEQAQGVTPLHWTFIRSAANGTSEAFDRDPRLIGQWTYSESYTSGTFSFAAQWHLLLAENGALQQTGRTVGGGPDIGADTGNGTTTQGRWRTAENIFLVDVGQGFSPMARFVCDGDRLVFTLTDGNKQVWIRE